MQDSILVTGAAGFIGSHLMEVLRAAWPHRHLVALDALTYAGSLDNLESFARDPHFDFVQADICDREALARALDDCSPSLVFHLAAESHVDRSVLDPLAFVRTNIEGTVVLLQELRSRWSGRDDVRLVQVSTDEVYGALGHEGAFSETSPFDPSSPYSASKASADLLARAFHRTCGFPVVITHCSNNYGSRQFPEKLIPVVVSRALQGEPVPVYGQGRNIRDWIHVRDHCQGLLLAAQQGRDGSVYCLGADQELTNIDLVQRILDAVDLHLHQPVGTSRGLIRFVTDRPGHDLRYAIDASRAHQELGWRPRQDFDAGLADTVQWFATHQGWCQRRRQGVQARFEAHWYGPRLL